MENNETVVWTGKGLLWRNLVITSDQNGNYKGQMKDSPSFLGDWDVDLSNCSTLADAIARIETEDYETHYEFTLEATEGG